MLTHQVPSGSRDLPSVRPSDAVTVMAIESRPTFERPHRPPSVRLYNWCARQLHRCKLVPDSLTEESMVRAAQRRTKLSDFGDDRFRVGFRQLLQSCREEARLKPFGRWIMRNRLIMSLENRLKVQEDLKRHPEILDVPIRQPLFVVGLPRSGTSLLYNLLAKDPASRPLLMWESFWPSPPPEPETRQRDPRIKQARQAVKAMCWMAPQLPVAHALVPDGPEECLPLLLNTFACPGFLMMAHLPGYEQWLRELDFDGRIAVYREYKAQLQLLQWRCPGRRWLLKCPVHLATMDALFHAFPDACVVQTHRDPAKVVPSVCSLFAMFRGMATDHIDPTRMGPQAADSMLELVKRAMEAREKTPGRVFDLAYADLVDDPAGAVHRIYEHFGYDCDPRMDAGMNEWLNGNPRHKKGVHRYDLSQFGLDRSAIEQLFGPYCERFKIVRETE